MIIFIEILYAAISTIILLCLGIYIFLAVTKKSLNILHSGSSERFPLLSLKNRIFLVLSAIGLLVCVYNGTKAMLFWMPNEWGQVDFGGEYQTWRQFLAFLFTMFGGVSLVGFINDAIRDKFSLKLNYERAGELEVIIKALDNEAALVGLKSKYENIIGDIKSKIKPEDRYYTRSGLRSLEQITISNYQDLIKMVEYQLARVNGDRSAK